MADRSAFWPEMPDWDNAAIHHPGVAVVPATPSPTQWLVSGVLPMACGGVPVLGPRDVIATASYALRLAPDRALVVLVDGDAPGGPTGTVASEVTDGFLAFDVTGDGATALLAKGTGYDLGATERYPDESACLALGGLRVALARLETGWRLHVERAWAPALWHWLATMSGLGLSPNPMDAS